MKDCGILLLIQEHINDCYLGGLTVSIHNIVKGILVLFTLCCCVSCVNEFEPTITPSPVSSATIPSASIGGETPYAKLPPYPNNPTVVPGTLSAMVSSPTTVITFSELLYAEASKRTLIPQNIEPYIYMLSITSPSLVTNQTTQKVWRYSLKDNVYELVTFWSLSKASNLADSVPGDYKPMVASRLGITLEDLAELKESTIPIKVSLSPDGQYLAFGTIIWVDGLEYDAQVKSSVLLYELSTGELFELWGSWEKIIGFGEFLWSSDGSKLAFQLTAPPDTFRLYVYEVLTSQLVELTQLASIARDNGGYETLMWDAGGENLVLTFSKKPDPFHILICNVATQYTKKLELPHATHGLVNNVFESAINETWIFYKDTQHFWLSELDVNTGELYPIIKFQDIPLTTSWINPQGNRNGTFITYERWGEHGDRLLRVLDLDNDADFAVLDAKTYNWEWSNMGDVILVRYSGEQVNGGQVGLIIVKDEIVITLPYPPDMGRYESIADLTW